MPVVASLVPVHARDLRNGIQLRTAHRVTIPMTHLNMARESAAGRNASVLEPVVHEQNLQKLK